MGSPVIIKGGKKYLTVALDADLPIDELYQNIVVKFQESERFIGSREPITIAFEGRMLLEEEKTNIVSLIEYYTSIRIALVVEKDEMMDLAADFLARKQLYEKAMAHSVSSEPEPVCTFISDSVEEGARISSENTIVVFGDVKEDAIVSSKEHVIILGTLYGQAVAGSEGEKNACIVAGALASPHFRIGNMLGAFPKKKGLFHDLKKQKKPDGLKIVHVVDDAIQIDYLSQLI